MANPIMTLPIAAAVLAAGLCCDAPPSRASFGNAAWCLVKTGDDVYWDCQYRSFQDCLRARSGVSFCDVNPAGPPASPAQAEPRKQHS